MSKKTTHCSQMVNRHCQMVTHRGKNTCTRTHELPGKYQKLGMCAIDIYFSGCWMTWSLVRAHPFSSEVATFSLSSYMLTCGLSGGENALILFASHKSTNSCTLTTSSKSQYLSRVSPENIIKVQVFILEFLGVQKYST